MPILHAALLSVFVLCLATIRDTHYVLSGCRFVIFRYKISTKIDISLPPYTGIPYISRLSLHQSQCEVSVGGTAFTLTMSPNGHVAHLLCAPNITAQ